jgi:tetratricopeptide (TPR) repeat protein
VRTRTGTILVAAVVALALAGGSPLSARPPQDEPSRPELEAAKQALLLGNVEEAIQIYEEFLELHPRDTRAFWGLANAYAMAGLDRERLVPLLEARLRDDPNDVRAREELGRAYARLGDHERAHEVFGRVLRFGPASVARYSEIGSLEVRHRMYQQAVETFVEARTVFGDPALFSQELAQIHVALADYDAAVDECLVTVEAHPGMAQWATNLVELMLEEGADEREIGRRIDQIADAEATGTGGLSFAGSAYLVLDRPDRALRAFLRADELSGEEGSALIDYGMILRDEGLHRQAREAFLMIEERYPGTTSAAVAGIEAARILVAEGDPAGAVLELKAVGEAFPTQAVSGEALLEAARIELHDLGDPDAALATLETLSGRLPRVVRRVEHQTVLLEADAYLALGRFADAHARAESVAAQQEKGEIHERALFLAGYASFLAVDIDRALDELRTMVEGETSGKLTNDALRLMLAIAEAKEAQDLGAITLFAGAHAARLAGDAEAADELLVELSQTYPAMGIAIEGLMLRGEIAEDEGDYREALRIYETVIGGTERIPARAEAMMRRGDIFHDRMGRTDEALAEYAAVLEELPPNYLSGEARRKIDRIRRAERVEG